MGKWPNIGLLHEKWEAGQKGYRSALLLPLKTGRVGVVVRGPPLAENLGSWCHLHEQSLKRLSMSAPVHVFCGKGIPNIYIFRVQSQP